MTRIRPPRARVLRAAGSVPEAETIESAEAEAVAACDRSTRELRVWGALSLSAGDSIAEALSSALQTAPRKTLL